MMRPQGTDREAAGDDADQENEPKHGVAVKEEQRGGKDTQSEEHIAVKEPLEEACHWHLI
jgi:hypothetical protein